MDGEDYGSVSSSTENNTTVCHKDLGVYGASVSGAPQYPDPGLYPVFEKPFTKDLLTVWLASHVNSDGKMDI